MNREILFRGKRYSNGEWVYGNLYMHTHNGLSYPMILQCKFSHVVESEFPLSFSVDEVNLVLPETVGQFTGLTDKNGVKIFEGDILAFSGIYKYQVVFRNGCFVLIHFNGLKEIDGRSLYWGPIFRAAEHGFEIEIIGNIHDNPELIGKEVDNA